MRAPPVDPLLKSAYPGHLDTNKNLSRSDDWIIDLSQLCRPWSGNDRLSHVFLPRCFYLPITLSGSTRRCPTSN